MVTYLPRGPRLTCAGCNEVVETIDGIPRPHGIEVYTAGSDHSTRLVPCPGNGHPAKEWPPEGYDGPCQRIEPLTWTRLSGSGDPGVEVFLMLDGRVCSRPADGANQEQHAD